jgi:drug/metabolite transporter (DMT)-like permease
MCIALAGVVFIFLDNLKDFSNPSYILGILAVLTANASWGAGTVYTKKNASSLSPLYAAGLQLFCAGVILNLISLIFETPYHLTVETDGLLALLYLIIFGSVVAFGAYLYAIAALPTAIVGTYAYINPVVAVILGWAFLDESLTMYIGIGFLMVLAGIYIVNTLTQKQRKINASAGEVKPVQQEAVEEVVG